MGFESYPTTLGGSTIFFGLEHIVYVFRMLCWVVGERVFFINWSFVFLFCLPAFLMAFLSNTP